MRALFVCDAGPKVGGGHVMRCLTLARAMQARGADCRFLATPQVASLLDRFAPEIARLDAGADEPAAAPVRADGTDLIVLDHYGLGAADHADFAGGRPTVVIDDLADRPLEADLIVDSGPHRATADYQGLIPDRARLLLGPAYAPVRPQFLHARAQALARRRPDRPVERILVSLGLGDAGGITGRVLDILMPMVGGLEVAAVMGSQAPSLDKVRALALAYGNLAVHLDVQEMADLAATADLAIGAGGSSSWERCVLALPALSLILADNQRPAARALEAAGAILALDPDSPQFVGAFEEDVARLLADHRLRLGMALAASEVCDGLGADRVADAVLDLYRTR